MKFSVLVVVVATATKRVSSFNTISPVRQQKHLQRVIERNLYTPSSISVGQSARTSATASFSRNSIVKPSRDIVSHTGSRGVSSTKMFMILDRLFGGGAMSAGIVYDNLDHPGPELANAAKAGKVLVVSEKDPSLQLATFAGGCFWGLELAYQRVPGVVYTGVGYAQGKEENPTYNQVCAGITGHTEAVIVYYDPKECTYEQLLDTFFQRVNPLTVNGQGNDYGKQYRTGVYPHSPEQMTIATARFEVEQQKYSRTIATELLEAKPFWPAEKYHQQYLEKGGQNAQKSATETIRCYG